MLSQSLVTALEGPITPADKRGPEGQPARRLAGNESPNISRPPRAPAPSSSTIAFLTDLTRFPPPHPWPPPSRIAPEETTYWTLDATLDMYKFENDLGVLTIERDDPACTEWLNLSAEMAVGGGIEPPIRRSAPRPRPAGRVLVRVLAVNPRPRTFIDENRMRNTKVAENTAEKGSRPIRRAARVTWVGGADGTEPRPPT
jgi:hypothetical protein